jgi:hypothetical protein
MMSHVLSISVRLKSWNDDYIGFNGYGNFETYSETDYQSQIDMYVKDLGLF